MADPTPNPDKTWGIPNKFFTPLAITLMTCVIGLMQALTAYMQSLTREAVQEAKVAIDETGEKAEASAKKAEKAVVSAKKEVERVKTALVESNETQAEKISDLKTTADSTHLLVNSSMAAQLKISAIALRRLADLTKNPDDIAAAELAEKNLKAHEIKQDKVDAIP